MLKNKYVISSKDFIAYGFGLDVLGENHVGSSFPKKSIKKIKNNRIYNKKLKKEFL